jgi:excisionase family DNA binding protein
VRVKEAAARLEVSPATIYALVASGKLRSLRVGMGRGVIRITEAHLAEFIAGTEPGPRSAPAPPARRVRLKHLHLG